MLVTDRSLCGGPDGLVAAVERAVAGGVDAIQLREKDLPVDEFTVLARRLRDVAQDQAQLLVNGPLTVALAAGADGVHLPEAAPAVERPGAGLLIGRSVHSLAAGRRAESEGVDYLVAGPVYETRSHPGRAPSGVALIEDVTSAAGLPVLAIGGIDSTRVGDVVRAGAAGVAVISAVLGAPDPREAASALRTALDAAWLRLGAAS
jgi:thiamine-phosphate pyrophosphorylase